jgi:hypothetical protein
MSNEISTALGLEPLVTKQEPDVIEIQQVDSDFEYARTNLINVIEKGQEALNGILDVAAMSQHPRGYEVAATLIKTMADVNKDLLELSKRKKELSGNLKAPSTVNNNLFVGSTAELQKILKKQDVND